jgi:branched-chain amino acid transport system ATP-binding protein
MSALLEVRNLETWYGPIAAMQGVNLQVEKGQMVTVLGANGAGKTTLLNTLAGVIDPFKGQVLLNNQTIHGLDADEVCRRGLVLVPEGRQIYPFLSVRENLNMGAYTRRDADAIGQDLERVFQWFPRLLERAQQHAGLLSGGEQQMLAIGRALVGNPRVMLMDEPTEGLSPLIVEGLLQAIRKIVNEGMAVLLVEQQLDVAIALADHCIAIDRGRLVYSGDAQDLRARQSEVEALVGVALTDVRADLTH